MDSIVLRNYLEKVRRLENDIYTMDQTMLDLERSKRGNAEKRYIAPPKKKVLDEPKLENYKKNAGAAGALGAGAGLVLLGPIGLVAGYAIGKKASKKSSEYDAAMEQYRMQVAQNEIDHQKALKEYENALAIEDNRCAREQEGIVRYNQNIDYQIASVRQLREHTKAVLLKLYSTDIIYAKYRSLIPVSRFCEYIDSGRRTELEGVNGMYDLYESELAAKQIVNGLHTVNEHLGQMSQQIGYLSYQLNTIQQNQGLLYQEISQCNATAREISCDLKEIAERQNQHYGVMENSAKLTAYNAEITKRNSEILADIAEYEHHKSVRQESALCL